MLLRVEADDEGRNVDDLLANTDVALADEDTGVVDSLGETKLEDASLKTTLQEIFDLESKHVIELHAGLIEDTDTNETTNEGIAFEETLGVLLVEGQELTIRIVSYRVIQYLAACRLGKHTEQHDESWTESDRLARPHACCGDHTRQRASTQSPCCIYRSVSFAIDLNRDKLMFSGR